MAWFSSQENDTTPVDEVRPISRQRIEEQFKGQGWLYAIDEEGDVGAQWGETLVFFLLRGDAQEILNVTGRLVIPIPADKTDEARLFVEDWNRDKLWPKVFYYFDDQERFRVAGEVVIDHEHGASDAQLLQHLRCGISSMTQCFDSLIEALELEPTEE